MEAYYAVGRWVVIGGLFVQFIMLALQASALRRHGQKCFVLLCLDTILFAAYMGLSGFPYFYPISLPTALTLLKIGMVFAVLGSVLGIWGTILLFRAYRNLSEHVARTTFGAKR